MTTNAPANTKARQLRALIAKSRTKDLDKLIAKVNESDIGIPETNVRRYVVANLARVLAAKQADADAKAAKKAAKKPAAKARAARKSTSKAAKAAA